MKAFKIELKINWQSVGAAVSSLLTMIAVAPYTLGDAATIIPPAWKAKVFGVCLTTGFLLRLWNSRHQKIEPVQVPPPQPPELKPPC